MDIFNKYFKIARKVYTEDLTLEQFFNNYNTIVTAEDEIKAELQSKTVKVLKSVNAQLGNWHDPRDKKADLIKSAYESLTSYFQIGRGVSYSPFSGETFANAKEKLIKNTTAETLNNFYTKRKEEAQKLKKALTNPETLSEFRTFIKKKGKEELTPEQITKFEELTADMTLQRQKRDEERENQVNKIQNKNVEFKLHETKHSKTGADIYTVLMINRVDKDEFKALRAKAKKIGGYYSRYTNLNANPPIKAGFNFDTKEEAEQFMALKESDQNTTDKAEAKKEEKQLSTAEKMKQRAKKIIEKAEESLNQDRQTNTARRARMASSAEADARQKIKFAKTLINIAKGFEKGEIKYLHKLKHGVELEQLNLILLRGKYKRVDTLNLSYRERQEEEAQNKPLEDVNFIVYPYPRYYFEHFKNVLLKLEDTKGCKKIVKGLLKSYRKLKNSDTLIIKSEHTIKDLKKISKHIFREWDKDKILEPIKDYERIVKLGLTNEAILKTALRELISLKEGTEISEEEKQQIKIQELERSFVSKKIDGFFPTPKNLIDRVLHNIKINENDTILEPSGGLGHIAEEIRSKYPKNPLNVVEIHRGLSEVLTTKGFNVENTSFLNITEKYDVIIMNPPFEKHQDIDHLNHAFSLLNEGGRIACIMANNKNEHSKNQKIKDFLELVNEYGYIQENEEGSFKSAFRSTGVSTITVYLEKPQAEETPQAEKEETPQPQQQTEVKCNAFNQFELF